MVPGARQDLSRLEAFSDAVFAFALTLLVVSLEVPSSYADLMRLMTGFVPFAASFALLTWIWYEHTAFFRAYRLQDPLTATINAMLLFVVLFYVYPLKFLFTAAFSTFIPVMEPTLRATGGQLARIYAIYGAGFVAIFLIFTLLHVQAYRCRTSLQLTPLQIFDLRRAGGAHLVSVAVGLAAILMALVPPLEVAVFSGLTYFLMAPAHWIYGVTGERRRNAFLAALERDAAVAAEG